MSGVSGSAAYPLQGDRCFSDPAAILTVPSVDDRGTRRADRDKISEKTRLIPEADGQPVAVTVCDDLSREVYCILGVPIDAIEMPDALRRIEAAAATAEPFVLSTPNLNFLVNSQTDAEFRQTLLMSDLCPPDGAPIIWIARLLGIPITKRTAGSDIFDALKDRPRSGRELKVFLFGATEQTAAIAARKLNDNSRGLRCVGWTCPGFGSLDELSQDRFINQINASGADLLVVALGARKGQLWLQRNGPRLTIPVRTHLGAVINFQAGTVRRAPHVLRKLGLEWLWRIKEEPYLWRRYWHDGGVLLRLLVTRLLPLAISARRLQRRASNEGHDLVVVPVHGDPALTLRLVGCATARDVANASSFFRDALIIQKQIVVDFAETKAADARFFGLLLMLKKQLTGRGLELQLAGVSIAMERQFRLHGLGYLLSASENRHVNALR